MIDIKNSYDQDIDVFSQEDVQIINIVNELDQQVQITEQNDIQNLGIENAPDQEIIVKQDIEIIKVYDDLPKYTGKYDVIPRVDAQTLPTSQKFLEKDVTISKIPYFEVSNNSGGDTVYIGNEV